MRSASSTCSAIIQGETMIEKIRHLFKLAGGIEEGSGTAAIMVFGMVVLFLALLMCLIALAFSISTILGIAFLIFLLLSSWKVGWMLIGNAQRKKVRK